MNKRKTSTQGIKKKIENSLKFKAETISNFIYPIKLDKSSPFMNSVTMQLSNFYNYLQKPPEILEL